MSNIIVAQRIVRHKGSKVGVLVGNTHVFGSLESLRAYAKRVRKVFAYIASDESEGTMRSGRKMRPVDANVKNIVTTLKK